MVKNRSYGVRKGICDQGLREMLGKTLWYSIDVSRNDTYNGILLFYQNCHFCHLLPFAKVYRAVYYNGGVKKETEKSASPASRLSDVFRAGGDIDSGKNVPSLYPPPPKKNEQVTQSCCYNSSMQQ